MENTLMIALSRQTTLKREMATVANNIANMNTQSYKRESMMFEDHLMRSKGGDAIMGDKLKFVRDVSQYRDHSEGTVEDTGNPLDIMIHGDGYFVIETPAGERYTRNGHFELNNEGVVVTSEGHPVLTEDGDQIEILPGNERIEISPTGQIYTDAGPLGKLGVVEFDNEQTLQKVSSTLFSHAAGGTQVEQPHVLQGKLEGSNVQPIIEMTRMIDIHRSYEKAKQLVGKEDERIKKSLSLITDR